MTWGLLLTALGLGLRHGIDWDHIAAIADLSGSAENRKRGFALSMAYALGHAAVVFALGAAAVAFGLAIPDGLDTWMGRVVGITLIALGLWILVELLRKGREFRLRSRWMLVIDGTFAGLRRVRNSLSGRQISVEHEHDHLHDAAHASETASHGTHAAAHDHAHHTNATRTVDAGTEIDLRDGRAAEPLHDVAAAAVPVGAAAGANGGATTVTPGRRSRWTGGLGAQRRTHRHAHQHDLVLPDQPDARYGAGTATGVGLLHGVGVESPTQIAIFVASSSAAGVGFGLTLLAAWVVGLVIANMGLALAAGAGLLSAERSFPVYATVAVVVSVLSIALGAVYLAGWDLPVEL
jgi:cytochrome c biogenesis protein CcdA